MSKATKNVHAYEQTGPVTPGSQAGGNVQSTAQAGDVQSTGQSGNVNSSSQTENVPTSAQAGSVKTYSQRGHGLTLAGAVEAWGSSGDAPPRLLRLLERVGGAGNATTTLHSGDVYARTHSGAGLAGRDVSAIAAGDVRELVRSAAGSTSTSRGALLSALRELFSWLQRRLEVASNPVSAVAWAMRDCLGCGGRKFDDERVCPFCGHDEEPLGGGIATGDDEPFNVAGLLDAYEKAARAELERMGYPWHWRARVPVPNGEDIAYDAEVPQLGLLSLPGGAFPEYVLDWQTTDGASSRFRIGAAETGGFGGWSVEAARKRALELMARFPDGFLLPEPAETAPLEELLAAIDEERANRCGGGAHVLRVEIRRDASDATVTVKPDDGRDDVEQRRLRKQSAAWVRQVQDLAAILRQVRAGRQTLELWARGEIDAEWFQKWLWTAAFRLGAAVERAQIRAAVEKDLLIEAKAATGRKKGRRTQNGKAAEKASATRIRELFGEFEKRSKVKVTQSAAAKWIAGQVNKELASNGEVDKKGRPKVMKPEGVRARLKKLGLPRKPNHQFHV